MRRRNSLATASAALLLTVFAPTASAAEPEECTASWYPQPDGAPVVSASGETVNPLALTGAHRTLPFDTVVRVTNRNDKRSVDIRINDRGPYADDRCVNLTSGAFSRIAPLTAGVVPVTVEVVRPVGQP